MTSLLLFELKEQEAKAAAAAATDKKEVDDTPKTNFVKQDTYKHLAYSSELTSLTALKQANCEFNPNGVAMVVYEHMMVPGINELYYKAAQNDPSVMMTKGVISEVRDGGDGDIIVVTRGYTAWLQGRDRSRFAGSANGNGSDYRVDFEA